jgi:guanine deaminase
MAIANEEWMARAIRLAVENVHSGRGGPFGAVVVRDGELIASGTNQVTAVNDPTAHAEVVAIRAACQILGTFQLEGCEIFTSCEPCPMCLGAIYWARPDRFYFACSREDAARAGFDDDHIYKELALPPEGRSIPGLPLLTQAGLEPFNVWRDAGNKIHY